MLPMLLMLTLLVPTVSRAELVAGWDFSDLPVDGAFLPSPYPANVTGSRPIVSTNLSLTGDLVASALPPGFDATDDAGLQGGVRGLRGFTFEPGSPAFGRAQFLGLTARGPASLEFEMILSGSVDTFWVMTFGGTMIPAGTGIDTLPIQVAFGEDCSTAAAGNGTIRSARYVLDPTDRTFVAWAGIVSNAACARIDVDGSTVQPLLDNFSFTALSAPEPSLGIGLPVGLLTIAVAGRRHRSFAA